MIDGNLNPVGRKLEPANTSLAQNMSWAQNTSLAQNTSWAQNPMRHSLLPRDPPSTQFQPHIDVVKHNIRSQPPEARIGDTDQQTSPKNEQTQYITLI